MTKGLKGYLNKCIDLSSDLSSDDAVAEMEDEEVCFGLVRDKDGNLLGLVQLSDLLTEPKTGEEDAGPGELPDADIKEVMSSEYTGLRVSQALHDAIELMSHEKRKYGVITGDSDEPIGIVTIDDLKDAAGRAGCEHDRISLREARQWLPPLTAVAEKASLNCIKFNDAYSIIVVDDFNHVTGIITMENIEKHRLHAMFKQAGRPPFHRMALSMISPMPDDLPGLIRTKRGMVICKACKAKNKVQFLDHEHPPVCQSTELRKHKLRW